jgi:hypothetical protein
MVYLDSDAVLLCKRDKGENKQIPNAIKPTPCAPGIRSSPSLIFIKINAKSRAIGIHVSKRYKKPVGFFPAK